MRGPEWLVKCDIDGTFLKCSPISQNTTMRGPGIGPGPQRWQRRIITTILPTHEISINWMFKNILEI